MSGESKSTKPREADTQNSGTSQSSPRVSDDCCTANHSLLQELHAISVLMDALNLAWACLKHQTLTPLALIPSCLRSIAVDWQILFQTACFAAGVGCHILPLCQGTVPQFRRHRPIARRARCEVLPHRRGWPFHWSWLEVAPGNMAVVLLWQGSEACKQL